MTNFTVSNLRQTYRYKLYREMIVSGIFLLCGILSIVTTLGIFIVVISEAIPFFSKVSFKDFFFDPEWTPLFIDKHFGIAPLLCGTFLVSIIAISVALPFGLIIAIYLSEFANSKTRSIVKPFLEVLAGIPTVVYGYFALISVTPLLKKFLPDLYTFNALSPGIVMGIMLLPMVASLSEDAIYSVPRSLKEGAYALGAGKVQVIFGVVIPAALGGIVSSFILAMSRAIGETMIVTIAAGQQPQLTMNPQNSIETMTDIYSPNFSRRYTTRNS